MSTGKRREDEEIRARFLEALDYLRRAGASMGSIADVLRVTPSALYKLRAGKSARPDERTVLLLKLLGVNPSWVETGLGEMELPGPTQLTADRPTAYDAPAGEGQALRQARDSTGPEWQVTLSDAEARLVLCYRAAAERPEDQADMLRTAELLAHPAPPGTERSTAADPGRPAKGAEPPATGAARP